MATVLTNPTPAQRATLAADTAGFLPYVKASMATQAAGLYTASLRDQDWNTWVFVQMAMLDSDLDGTPISQRLAQVIAWHPQAPAGWFSSNFQFVNIDPAALDTAVMTAFKIVAGI